MTTFAQTYAITDVCFLVDDIERASAFYVRKMGFVPRRRATGFADFKGAGITLALWELAHIASQTGVSGRKASTGTHKACAAIELPSPAAVDDAFEELVAAGVVFQGAPGDYDWNARCCYFADPDDNLWELYAWLEGGPIGDL